MQSLSAAVSNVTKRFLFIRHRQPPPPFYSIGLEALICTLNPPFPSPPPPSPPPNHSTSEINEHIALHPWGEPGFIDPGIRDAKLSVDGAALARARAPAFQTDHAQFLADTRLIVSSPLTRALQTAELLLPPPGTRGEIPRIMLPLAAERVYLTYLSRSAPLPAACSRSLGRQS
jgi:hypothetical protein